MTVLCHTCTNGACPVETRTATACVAYQCGDPLARILAVLGGRRFDVTDEYRLQAGVSACLVAAGIAHRREVVLSARDRVDHMALGFAIECKVGGSKSDVARQVLRYLSHSDVRGVILVTAAARLAVGLPSGVEIAGVLKPVRVVETWRGAL